MIIALAPPPECAAVLATVDVAGVAVVTARDLDLSRDCFTVSHFFRHCSSVSKLLPFPSHPL